MLHLKTCKTMSFLIVINKQIPIKFPSHFFLFSFFVLFVVCFPNPCLEKLMQKNVVWSVKLFLEFALLLIAFLLSLLQCSNPCIVNTPNPKPSCPNTLFSIWGRWQWKQCRQKLSEAPAELFLRKLWLPCLQIFWCCHWILPIVFAFFFVFNACNVDEPGNFLED